MELLSFNPLGIFSYGTLGRQIGVLQSRADPPVPAYRFTERKLNADGGDYNGYILSWAVPCCHLLFVVELRKLVHRESPMDIPANSL